jgi:hypothetical protein
MRAGAESVALTGPSEAATLPGDYALDDRAVAQLRGEIERLERRIAEAERKRADRDVGNEDPHTPVITLIDPRLPAGGQVVRTSAGVERRQVIGRIEAPAGLLSLAVNDRPQSVDEFDIFRAEVPVPSGGASVRIVAIDRQGRRTDLKFALRPESALDDIAPAGGPGGAQFEDLQALTRVASQERASFARPAFQCLEDLQLCSRNGFPWLDCQLTMLVCVFDLALP